jgi:hypothetical protein
VDGRELTDGIDRAYRPIVKSHHFLERAQTRFAEGDTDLEVMGPVAPLELSAEPGVRRNLQIITTVPVRDFPFRRSAGRASGGEHRDGFEDSRFSAGIWADGAKPGGVNRQRDLAK